MQDLVDFALETLRSKSPVGSGSDKHPGLYRDNHTVFLNGHIVTDVSSWRPGDQINISNPVPYARKIEAGEMKLSVPPHVYEMTSTLVQARYGNSFDVRFVYMPVRFGSVADFANSSAGKAFASKKRGGRAELHSEWLSRQPSLQISAR
jgi:hypothetical protein